MPFRQYLDRKSGSVIQATQAGHPGMLHDTLQVFEAGDWILKSELNLQEKTHLSVVKNSDFVKRYRIENNTEYWAQFMK